MTATRCTLITCDADDCDAFVADEGTVSEVRQEARYRGWNVAPLSAKVREDFCPKRKENA